MCVLVLCVFCSQASPCWAAARHAFLSFTFLPPLQHFKRKEGPHLGGRHSLWEKYPGTASWEKSLLYQNFPPSQISLEWVRLEDGQEEGAVRAHIWGRQGEAFLGMERGEGLSSNKKVGNFGSLTPFSGRPRCLPTIMWLCLPPLQPPSTQTGKTSSISSEDTAPAALSPGTACEKGMTCHGCHANLGERRRAT